MALPLIARLLQFRQFESVYAALNALSEAAEARLVAIVANTTITVYELNPAPAATSTTALKAATATTVADQTILAAAMLSGGKNALLAYPRIPTFTLAGADASHGPTSIDLVGTDIDGNALTETISITPSAATFPAVKAYKTLTSYTCKGATGTDATVAAGIGSTFGLPKKIKSRADRYAVLQEVYSASGTGAVVTNGVIVAPGTCAPYGGYTPNSAPDGTKKYSLSYEQDLS